MTDLIRDSLQGIGPHFLYFIVSLAVAGVFLAIYTAFTPYREFQLIRAGNLAASISLSGALVGFSLPLAKAVAQSGSLGDMLIWAAVALFAQLLAFLIARLMLKDLVRDVQENKSAAAVLLAAISISIGWLNAAAMTA